MSKHPNGQRRPDPRVTPPDAWLVPYARADVCWGCGSTPDLEVWDRHYGHGIARRYCIYCWELIEPAMRRLARPPLGSGGVHEPITVCELASPFTPGMPAWLDIEAPNEARARVFGGDQ